MRRLHDRRDDDGGGGGGTFGRLNWGYFDPRGNWDSNVLTLRRTKARRSCDNEISAKIKSNRIVFQVLLGITYRLGAY